MMSLIQYSALLFIVISCMPFKVWSNEHQTESLIQPQEPKTNRPTQHTTIVQKIPTLHYPNHQTRSSYPLQHGGNKNVTIIFNNHQPDTSKRLTNNNYSNHRIEENVTVQQRKNQGITNNEKKKDKFVINIDDDDEDYKPSHHLANKQKNMRAVLTNLLRKSEKNENFAAVLPILKVMSPAQRVAMASLVTNQISSEGKNSGLKLAQVKSMFGNNSNATSDLMLPIILDIANLFRALKDSSKKKVERLPQPELLRRSFSENAGGEVNFSDIASIFGKTPARSLRRMDVIDDDEEEEDESDIGVINNSTKIHQIIGTDTNLGEIKNSFNNQATVPNTTLVENGNFTAEDLPVAEELRYINKFRNGNVQMPRPLMVRRPIQSGHNLPPNHPNRRMSSTEQRRRQAVAEQQKLASAGPAKCNFFTETLCLDVSDYPMHAITASIRKNLNVMNALHSDFPEISADSTLDGISKKQEDRYTPEHYLNNINRREDGETRPADASGFMCPSIVKYARPQKARATSGHWKYIVNTGEHTQTLRLEKCLKPKESCTFLTDNFKSKCVQVYNYHRLLTWDQQNGLHMDIFKVPTCCSCHIEGYSFAFPPHNGKPLEVTSESFPGEELIHESGKNRYAYASTPVRQTVSKETILNAFRNGNSEDYSSLSPLHHFNFPKNDPSLDIQRQPASHQFPSLNTNFYDEIYQTQDTNIHTRHVKKPLRESELDTELPSFLEPPSKPSVPHPKIKPAGNVYVKRGHVGNQGNILKRPVRKPIRKKISQIIVEDQDVGASDNHETQNKLSPELISGKSHTKIPNVVRSSTDMPTSSLNKSSTQHFSTTERQFTKVIPPERGNGILKDISLNRRINYNYHPIIDFFGESNNEKTDHVASDRIDSVTEFNSHEESDWRPMTGPISLPLKSPSSALTNSG